MDSVIVASLTASFLYRILHWKFCSESSVVCNLQSNEELSGRGIVVGCYDNPDSEGGYELSEAGRRLDSGVEGRLSQLLAVSGGRVKRGDTRLLYDVTTDHTHVAVVGVGPRYPDNGLEDVDMKRQNVRCAAAGKSNYCSPVVSTAVQLTPPPLPSPPPAGTKALQQARVQELLLDDLGDAEASAEGSTLSLFSCDKLKAERKRRKIPATSLWR